MLGTIIIEPHLTEHLKACKEVWFETTLGDDRVHISDLDDDFLEYTVGAIDTQRLVEFDEIGQANIDNAMET